MKNECCHKGTKAPKYTKKSFFKKKPWCLGVLVAKNNKEKKYEY